MATPSVSSVVREILQPNVDLPADEVIKRAKAKGVTATPASIRATVHNIRSVMRKAQAAAGDPVPQPVPAAAAARQTTAPAALEAPAPAVPTPAVASPMALPTDLAGMLAGVALVNRLVDECGGIEHVRHAAEAVQACGGVDPFLQHLDLIATIRKNPAVG